MTRRQREANIIRSARSWFDGLPVDWSQCKYARVAWDDIRYKHAVTCRVEWRSKRADIDPILVLTAIYTRDGDILQAGTSYGVLTL